MSVDDDLVARLRRRRGVGPGNGRARRGAGGLTSPTLVAAALARADADDLVDVAWAVQDTPIGPLTLAATPSGLVHVASAATTRCWTSWRPRCRPGLSACPPASTALRHSSTSTSPAAATDFDLALDRRLSRLPAGRAGSAQRGPLRRDRQLQGPGRAHGQPGRQPGGGQRHGHQPHPHRRALPPGAAQRGRLGNYGGGVDMKVWLLRLEGSLLG